MRAFCSPHLVNGPFDDPALYVRLAHQRAALLFDCGDLQRLSPRERLRVAAVFVSHCHIDHLVGFDTLLRAFLYQERELLVCGPPGMIDHVAARLAGYAWNLFDQLRLTVRVREYGVGEGREAVFHAAQAFARQDRDPVPLPGGLLCTAPGWRVRALPLCHGTLDSLAFALEEPLRVAVHPDRLAALQLVPGPWLTEFKRRLQQGESDGTICVDGRRQPQPLAALAAEIAHCTPGRRLCYVTDADPSEENLARLVPFAEGADLLVIEAVFPASEATRARQRHHLTAALAGTVAGRARVRRLLTFHHSPRYRRQPALLDAEAQAAFRAILHR